ncbi:MAG: hypothetical protein KKB79_02130 [Nanoarchaeota archaeon]|nr:hypothetical protein [Nanoarchaeota archaeon]
MSELKDLNETLKKIEKKIKDKSPTYGYSLKNIFDFEKRNEESRKEREEKRNDEVLKLQGIQVESMQNQKNFTKIVAFTGAIIALTTIYTFLVKSVNLVEYPKTYWPVTIIFLVLIFLCLSPLISFIINFWKEDLFRR